MSYVVPTAKRTQEVSELARGTWYVAPGWLDPASTPRLGKETTMAEVKDVTLAIAGVPNDNTKRKVTVSYKLVFDAAEAGKKYKLAINLFGEDKSGDDEDPNNPPLVPAKPIYTFRFVTALPRLYKTITAQAGQNGFTESQEVDASKLNEDPGNSGPPLNFPHIDEVYAVVGVTAEARSATESIIL